MAAPIGYLDQGPGLPKIPDPILAPLVRQTFELYATGRYNLRQLGEEAYRRGLRNKQGGRVSRNGFSTLLNNAFYCGVIRMRSTGECYTGVHKPLISNDLFQAAQSILRRRKGRVPNKHEYTYRRKLSCVSCGYSLVGERQKGHVYYRCHGPSCRSVCLRETAIDEQVFDALGQLVLPADRYKSLMKDIEVVLTRRTAHAADDRAGVKLRLNAVISKLQRLTDAYLEGEIDRSIYLDRQTQLLADRAQLMGEQQNDAQGRSPFEVRLSAFLELLSRFNQSLDDLKPEEMRNLLGSATSNLRVAEKQPVADWKPCFSAIIGWNPQIGNTVGQQKTPTGVPIRSRSRTLKAKTDEEDRKSSLKIAEEVVACLERPNDQFNAAWVFRTKPNVKSRLAARL